jgi:regulatory protein
MLPDSKSCDAKSEPLESRQLQSRPLETPQLDTSQAREPVRAGSRQLSDKSPGPKSIEATALRLLAHREHSTDELRRKLLRRGHPPAAIDVVLGQLAVWKLISDARFAGGLVRGAATRGHGPVRIRAELRRQGIDEAVIQAEFAEAGCDWLQLAARVRIRKFGVPVPANSAERAKQARFLQYRGFTADQIRAALGSDTDSDSAWLDAACQDEHDPDC